jgi:uncharacterized membrane protein YccC
MRNQSEDIGGSVMLTIIACMFSFLLYWSDHPSETNFPLFLLITALACFAVVRLHRRNIRIAKQAARDSKEPQQFERRFASEDQENRRLAKRQYESDYSDWV